MCLVIATIPACLISMLLYSCIELPTRLAGEEDAERRGEEGRGEEKEGEKSERDSRERERGGEGSRIPNGKLQTLTRMILVVV